MAVTILDLDVSEQATLSELLDQLGAKVWRNMIRDAYYDGKRAWRGNAASLPESLRNLKTVLGWPAKAVDALNNRCRLEGLVWPGVDDPSVLDEVWEQNWLELEAPQVGASALIHSVAWLITTRGDVEAGEPKALVTSRDAKSGTALWDPRRRAIRAFLSVLDTDESGPTSMVMYLPGVNVILNKVAGAWRVQRRGTGVDRVMVEALTFRPRLGRPFGSSRISRPIMSLTDLAIRTVVRSEVTGEQYSVPQRIFLNVAEKSFRNADGSPADPWRLVYGKALALESDPDVAAEPKVVQLQQGSQDPHMAQLRGLAQLFAGESAIPIGELGMTTEANPASADAYFASREPLITLSEDTVSGWSAAWRRTAINAVMVAEDLDEPPADAAKIRARFRSPLFTSRAAAADAMVKNAAVFPWMAESDAAVELLGFDEVMTERLLADKRRAGARSLVADLAAAAGDVGAEG